VQAALASTPHHVLQRPLRRSFSVGDAKHKRLNALACALRVNGFRAAVCCSLECEAVRRPLCHCFIRISSPATPPYGSMGVVVDPAFREQWETPRPTPRYLALLSSLPDMCVVYEHALPTVVELLSSELALSFLGNGLEIPPWREASAMLSRWQAVPVPGGSSVAQAPPCSAPAAFGLPPTSPPACVPAAGWAGSAGDCDCDSSLNNKKWPALVGIYDACLALAEDRHSSGAETGWVKGVRPWVFCSVPGKWPNSNGSPNTAGSSPVSNDVPEPRMRIVGGNFVEVPYAP